MPMKRCAKCGWQGRIATRIVRCRQQKFGPRSFWCYGRLETVAAAAAASCRAAAAALRVTAAAMVGDPPVSSERTEYERRRKVFEKKLTRARANQQAAMRRARVAMAAERRNAARASEYMRVIAQTFEEFIADRIARKQKQEARAARTTRRAVAPRGGVG